MVACTLLEWMISRTLNMLILEESGVDPTEIWWDSPKIDWFALMTNYCQLGQLTA
jgi:hypothetical protein